MPLKYPDSRTKEHHYGVTRVSDPESGLMGGTSTYIPKGQYPYWHIESALHPWLDRKVYFIWNHVELRLCFIHFSVTTEPSMYRYRAGTHQGSFIITKATVLSLPNQPGSIKPLRKMNPIPLSPTCTNAPHNPCNVLQGYQALLTI